jgi:hypothetical protein
LKDETAGTPVNEIISIAPKCWAIKIGTTSEVKAKGSDKRKLTFDHFKQVLKYNLVLNEQRTSFQSMKQRIVKVEKSKISLNPALYSRYVLGPKGIKTLPYGHYKLTN